MADLVLRIAVPAPLFRVFDYGCPPGIALSGLQPGVRVRVPFGRQRKVGFLLEVAKDSDVPAGRLKPVEAVLDDHPLFTPDLWEMLLWAAQYYRHPLGDVLAGALPVLLRQGHQERIAGTRVWTLTEAGAQVDAEGLQRAPRQAQVLKRLADGRAGMEREALGVDGAVLRAMEQKGWLECRERPCLEAAVTGPDEPPSLEPQQQAAVERVQSALDCFGVFLLEGVTGSGKTEVYLRLVEQVLAQDRQALVLVPEIGLTPQLVRRFRQRFPVPLAVLHSGLNDRERLCAWQAAAAGEAPIVLGTRSAVFTPLARPGLILVDEEHDVSLKQQDGFRYSARDLAIWRARRLEVPVLLGSATPSLESMLNVQRGRYQCLPLPQRAGGAAAPGVRLLDLRHQVMDGGFSPVLLEQIRKHLGDDGQVLLFLNRRGYAPTLICHDCGWVSHCDRCDAHMTFHQRERRLRCHHCGHERPVAPQCPDCGSADLRPVGKGTERIEEALAAHFPEVAVVRIDRDTTRRKGALEAQLEKAKSGEARILVGTQMLAKGHHFPNVTLVAILDADQGLFSHDFRGPERMAQLIIQVAGRAGRARRPGEVLIQTHHPEHPFWDQLIREGYNAFATATLAEREQAGFPPFASVALLRAEATGREAAMAFLEEARDAAAGLTGGGVEFWGPVPAPMERRAGRYRAQLMVSAGDRAGLHQLLEPWVPGLEQLAGARRVRWSLDVDPLEVL